MTEIPTNPEGEHLREGTGFPHGLRNDVYSKTEALLKKFQWRMPDEGERERAKGELERTSQELGLEYDSLQRAFDHALLEALSDEQWEQMENTDAHGAWTKQEVIEYIGARRDHGRIFRMIENGEALSGPIVLFRNDKPPYLIGGNTRLLACKALGIRPQILAVRI